MRTALIVIIIIQAPISYASEAVTQTPTVEQALNACTYLESLAEKYLTYTATDDFFPVLRSPLCVDWLREVRDMKRFRTQSTERIWKSEDGRFSVNARFVESSMGDSIVLKSSSDKQLIVELNKLHSSSQRVARFLNEYSRHVVLLAARTRVRENAYLDESKRRIAAGRSVIAFVDDSYLTKIGMDKAATIAQGLHNVMLPQLSEKEQRELWNAAVLHFYGWSPQRQDLLESILTRDDVDQMVNAKEVYTTYMSLSARERNKVNLERLKKGLLPLDEFSFSELESIVVHGLQEIYDAANAALEQPPRYTENVFGILAEELATVKLAQQRAMDGREVLSMRSNLDAYWDGAPERRRFYKKYFTELREVARNEETLKVWVEGIHVYYCARLLEYRRLRGAINVKNHRVDHQAFAEFLSSYSYAPLALQ